MRAFIKKLAFFLLPLAALFAPAFVILLWSGEFYPLSMVEHLMNQPQPILVGQAYSNFGPALQIDEVIARAPKVITLGNSHVGEFRSAFFKEPTIFYNTTGAVGPLSDYVYFINRLATPPKIIIANMEQTLFTPENAKNHVMSRPNPFTARDQPYDPFLESFFRNGGWWKVYTDYFSGKFTLADVFTPRQSPGVIIGLRARTTGDGFTNDGSSYWGNAIRSPLVQKKTLSDIDALAASITDTNGDVYGDAISNDSLAELRTFLELCKTRGITVIGFLPPLAYKEYRALKEHPRSTYASSFKSLAPTLAAVYRTYGFDFYDFTDISSFGSSDVEMVEAKHGGEKMYLRLFIKMAGGSTALNPLVDLSYLKERLASATSTYYVFGIESN